MLKSTINKITVVGMAAFLMASSTVATFGAQTTHASSVIVGCGTWISGNSTYAKCGSYDRYGYRIYSYNAFAMCRPIWGGSLRYVGGPTVTPYSTSRADCAWYESPASAGVNINSVPLL